MRDRKIKVSKKVKTKNVWPTVKELPSGLCECLILGPIHLCSIASISPLSKESNATFLKYGISGEFFDNKIEKYILLRSLKLANLLIPCSYLLNNLLTCCQERNRQRNRVEAM